MSNDKDHLHVVNDNDKLPNAKEVERLNKESDKLAQELGFNPDVWEGSE